MADEQVELSFWEWVAKVTEKLTFCRLKILDRKDISEDDYTLLKMMFLPYYRGEYPLYVTKPDLMPESVTQKSLFDDTLADKNDGIMFETPCAETVKEE
jgi:hypothetical protein